MDFSKVDLHQIPPEFLMNFNQEILDREASLKKQKDYNPSEQTNISCMAFVADKILNSKQ